MYNKFYLKSVQNKTRHCGRVSVIEIQLENNIEQTIGAKITYFPYILNRIDLLPIKRSEIECGFDSLNRQTQLKGREIFGITGLVFL